ncbi:MAG: baseplate J/gp47 family protein [Pyrinomonadaceae bacterium]
MTTINLRENRQVIDYLARDYDSFRQSLLDLVPAKLPEWTDRSEADFGVALVELFAYMGDVISYYQDRLANESFLATAQERRSVINHLRLVGYEMAPAAPAAASLSLVVANDLNDDVEIRRGDQFSTPATPERRSVTFEYTGEKPLVIRLGQLRRDSARKPDGSPLAGFKEFPDPAQAGQPGIPVREGRSVTGEVIGVSDGSPNQRYRLAQPRLLRDTLRVSVETAQPTPPWRLRRNLVFSRRAFTPEQLAALEQQERIASTLAFSRDTDPDYTIETDENDVTTVSFGDGQYGQIPQTGARIVASYRTGGGTYGNVGAGQITVVSRSPQLQLLGARVVNRAAASGGAERESVEQAARFAPTVFSSMQRAVTADDYVALARLFPGVSKARAEATAWNTVKLYVAPAGSGQAPSDVLRRDLLDYFEDKRMISTVIEVESPFYVPIVIKAQVGVLSYFDNAEVGRAASAAIRQLLDFDKVDFKQTLYLSKIYEVLEALDGVDNVFVTQFRRLDASVPVAPDGRILLGENEIPVLSETELSIQTSGGVA